MAVQIIDRRLSGRNKSVGNRERFMRRYKAQIAEAARRAVSSRGIRDIEQSESVSIPRKDISEPTFHHGRGGVRDTVYTGNKDYVRGDTIERPQGGAGGRGSQASNQGEGEDDFTFTLSKEEFMELFFDDLELPRLMRTHVGDHRQWKTRRAGFSTDGTPHNLAVVRTMRQALGRRIALAKRPGRELAEMEAALAALVAKGEDDGDAAHALRQQIKVLRERLQHMPYIDPIDLRFRAHTRVPVPITRAAMFCVMDVSGSMDEARKELAKRFFILLYLFLTRHYEKIDIIFIRHHTQASEVDENTFFHATESGGTVVSSALELLARIIAARYPAGEWNLYVAQASDGDNFPGDSDDCSRLLAETILPQLRYFAYVQVAEEEQNLWQAYTALQAQFDNFAMRKVGAPNEIYPVFRELFRKEGVET
ncbi:MAG: YeaH/YhbH family protein [Rhodanobacter sp.]|nr:MAG: YeaH/YhbH family protein [Rhodanobacter sp.]TAM13528.1 MAG: YeaH/YhbH family protein [Rhodanobacter sp.]TAM35719.1 MAG: YeaH/YhbH family protein [Rhodanobacter sp.]